MPAPKGKLASLVEKLRPDAPVKPDPEAIGAAVEATRAAKKVVADIQKKIAEKDAARAALDDRVADLVLCVELGIADTGDELAAAKRDLAALDDTLTDLRKGHAKATARVTECEAEQRRLAFAGEAKVLQKQCHHLGAHLTGIEAAVAELVKHYKAALDWSERMRFSWPRDYRLLGDGLLNLHAALASEMDRQAVNAGVRKLPGAAREYLGASYNDPRTFPSISARWEEASAHLLRMLTDAPQPAPVPAPAASSSAVEAQSEASIAIASPPAAAPTPAPARLHAEPPAGASAEAVNAWRRQLAEAPYRK